MLRRQVYDYFFIWVLGFLLYGIFKILSPFAGPLLTALVCAVTFYPIQHKLHRRFPKLSSGFRAALVNALVFIFFVTPILILGWAIIQESTALSAVFKQSTQTVAQWREGDALDAIPWVNHIRFFLSHAFGIRRTDFQENFINVVNAGLDYLSVAGSLIAKNALLLALDLLVMLFALFFMFRDGEKWWTSIQKLIPIRREHKEELAHRLRDALISIARGLFLTSLIQSVLATIGYLLVGAEGAVLLGCLTLLMSIVPFIGTCGVWGSAALFFFFKGHYSRGLFLLLWGILVVVGFVDTFLRPYLVGKKMEMPIFALFFALLGGMAVWGPKGLILGPLVVAITPIMLQIYRQHYLRRDLENSAS
jgi:predicted PurR-regulated permease PerM